MTLGDIIKEKRVNAKLKQLTVAEYLGIGQSAYVKIEQNTTELTVPRMYKLAELFKCSVLDFLTLEEKDLSIIKEENRFQGSTIDLYKGFLLLN